MFVSLFRCSLSYLFIFVCLLFRPIYNMLMHNNTSSCAFWSAQWIEIYIIDYLALMQVRMDIMVFLERAQGCTRRLPCSFVQSTLASWTGGLRISDVKSLGWALQMRWLWLQKMEPHMGYPCWYLITSRGGGLSYLETLAQRSILGRVGLWRFLLWFHPFWTVGKNLENLGTGKMKNFLVVGCIW